MMIYTDSTDAVFSSEMYSDIEPGNIEANSPVKRFA